MIEVITKWNLTRPDEEINDFIERITLRGNNIDEVGLTGEFKSLLAENRIKPLSVGNIADKICPTRRDLYFQKGINKLRGTDKITWGRKTGKFVENYFYKLKDYSFQYTDKKYTDLNDEGTKFSNAYFVQKNEEIVKLKELEITTIGTKEGDTEWLQILLRQSGRAEMASKLVHSIINQAGCIDLRDLEIEKEVNPNTNQIGINSPTTPDFIISQFGIVGDIKTGINFENKYQLTCTGYALAYENETGKAINWGIIYFIPTRTPSRYARIHNYPQIHIFPINQELRQWFLDNRDEAYRINSQLNSPRFPDNEEREECPHCKYKEYCESQGLSII